MCALFEKNGDSEEDKSGFSDRGLEWEDIPNYREQRGFFVGFGPQDAVEGHSILEILIYFSAGICLRYNTQDQHLCRKINKISEGVGLCSEHDLESSGSGWRLPYSAYIIH
jgi:hypothetical protein